MTREIKFRAWDGERMVYPDSYGWYYGIKVANCSNPQMIGIGAAIQAENIILQQAIGLKDGNGQDIYEGDIVEHETRDIIYECEVIWKDCAFMLKAIPSGVASLVMPESRQLKVIGNIFENKNGVKNENS